MVNKTKVIEAGPQFLTRLESRIFLKMKKIIPISLEVYPDTIRPSFIQVSSVQWARDHSRYQLRCCSLQNIWTMRWLSDNFGGGVATRKSPLIALFLRSVRIAYYPTLRWRKWSASLRDNICLGSRDQQSNASSPSTWTELYGCGRPVRVWGEGGGEAQPDLTAPRTWMIRITSLSAISPLECPALWIVSIQLWLNYVESRPIVEYL